METCCPLWLDPLVAKLDVIRHADWNEMLARSDVCEDEESVFLAAKPLIVLQDTLEAHDFKSWLRDALDETTGDRQWRQLERLRVELEQIRTLRGYPDFAERVHARAVRSSILRHLEQSRIIWREIRKLADGLCADLVRITEPPDAASYSF
jgi:hypothetical protein